MNLEARKSPKQERSKFTMSSVFTAARDLLEDPNLKKLTTSRLAQKAGMSIGSLYQYFPSADSVVLNLMERVLDEQIAEIDAILTNAKAETLERKIRLVISYYVDSICKKPRTTQYFANRFFALNKKDFLSKGDKKLISVLKKHLISHESELRICDLDLSLLFVVETIRMVPTATMMTRPDLFSKDSCVNELTYLTVRYLKM